MKGKKARDGLNSFNDDVRFVVGRKRRRRMKVDEERMKRGENGNKISRVNEGKSEEEERKVLCRCSLARLLQRNVRPF